MKDRRWGWQRRKEGNGEICSAIWSASHLFIDSFPQSSQSVGQLLSPASQSISYIVNQLFSHSVSQLAFHQAVIHTVSNLYVHSVICIFYSSFQSVSHLISHSVSKSARPVCQPVNQSVSHSLSWPIKLVCSHLMRMCDSFCFPS